MKHDEANRRIEALVEFREAVSAVVKSSQTGRDLYGNTVFTGGPRPGHEQEWGEARARVDRLSMKAGRASDTAGV